MLPREITPSRRPSVVPDDEAAPPSAQKILIHEALQAGAAIHDQTIPRHHIAKDLEQLKGDIKEGCDLAISKLAWIPTREIWLTKFPNSYFSVPY